MAETSVGWGIVWVGVPTDWESLELEFIPPGLHKHQLLEKGNDHATGVWVLCAKGHKLSLRDVAARNGFKHISVVQASSDNPSFSCWSAGGTTSTPTTTHPCTSVIKTLPISKEDQVNYKYIG